jgi:uncharacterized DUF497 family protein
VSRYRWDPAKERASVRRHGISFDEAATIFETGPHRSTVDSAHSQAEERFVSIGWSSRGRLLVVITSEAEARPRIISARRATKRERDGYERRR